MRAFVGVLIFLSAATAGVSMVQAQTSPAVMAAKIEAIERQLRLLQRGGSVPTIPDQAATSDDDSDRRLIADLSAQLGTLERQIRQLNGRLEEYEYKQNELSDTVEQLRDQMALQREQMLSFSNNAPTSATQNANTGGQAVGTDQAPVSAVKQETASAPQVQLPAGDAAAQYQYAFDFIQKNDLDSGRIAMEQFLKAHTDDTRAANAKFWLGRINMQQDNNGEAARLFLNLIEDHPNHNRRVDALIDLADVLVAMNAPQDACNALAEFRRDEDKASDRLKTRARRISETHKCGVF